jgi:LysM repeat protein
MSSARRPRRRSPATLLAPIALVAFGIALLLVLSNGGGSGSSSGSNSSNTAAEKRDLGSGASQRKQRHKQRTSTTKTTPTGDVYVVKQGDTLAGIAQTTGVPVARLQELNPGLDQFSLVAGQRIKLR